jgi:hypothetical protein
MLFPDRTGLVTHQAWAELLYTPRRFPEKVAPKRLPVWRKNQHRRFLIVDNRSETLPLDWVPNFNPSIYTYCREQLTTGGERQDALVEAFPISHDLVRPG